MLPRTDERALERATAGEPYPRTVRAGVDWTAPSRCDCATGGEPTKYCGHPAKDVPYLPLYARSVEGKRSAASQRPSAGAQAGSAPRLAVTPPLSAESAEQPADVNGQQAHDPSTYRASDYRPRSFGSYYDSAGRPAREHPDFAPRLSAYAIGTLVAGLLAAVPIAIGLGIAALRRTRGGAARGRGLAVTGLALSGIWIALIGLVAYDAHQAQRSSATVVGARQENASQLRVGQCVAVPTTDTGANGSTVMVVPCSQPHDGQVFAAARSSDTSFPGSAALTEQALDDCSMRVSAFLGTERTLLQLMAFTPQSQGWAAGDRTEHCVLVDRAQSVTGDIRSHA